VNLPALFGASVTVNSVVAGSTVTDGSVTVSCVSSFVRATWTVVPAGSGPRFNLLISVPVKTTERGVSELKAGNGMVVDSFETLTVSELVEGLCVGSPAKDTW
jgi:hypothetical protein